MTVAQQIKKSSAASALQGGSRAPFFQPKLTINSPNDEYEREADAVAEKVVQQPAPLSEKKFFSPPAVQRKCAACEEEETKKIQKKPIANASVQRQEENEESPVTAVPSPALLPPLSPPSLLAPAGSMDFLPINQRFFLRGVLYPGIYAGAAQQEWERQYRLYSQFGLGGAVGNSFVGNTLRFFGVTPPGGDWNAWLANTTTPLAVDSALSRDFPTFNEQEERRGGLPVPTIINVPAIHFKEAPGSKRAAGEVSHETEDYLNHLSGGKPLSQKEKTFFEPAIGVDFSDVRIHTDSAANESAKSLNALAYTLGNNIVFGAGQYNTHTENGKKLMAHELTHTIQQSPTTIKPLMRKANPDEPAFYEDLMGGKKEYEAIKTANLQSWYQGYKFFNLFEEEKIYPGSHPNAYATRVYELQEKLHTALGASYPGSNITGELEPDFSSSVTLNALLGLAQAYEKDPSQNFDLNPAMLVRIRGLVKSIDQQAPPLESAYFLGVPQLMMVNAGKPFLIRKDDRGAYVERIQMALVELHYTIGKDLTVATDTDNAKVSGVYSEDTKKAVEQFQIDAGMEGNEIDGIVGQITLRLLDKRLQKKVKSGVSYAAANAISIQVPVTEADIPKTPADAEIIKKTLLIRSITGMMPVTKEEAENLVNAGWKWISYKDVTLADVARGYVMQSVTKDDYEKIMGERKSTGGTSPKRLSEEIIEQALFLQTTGTLYNLNAELDKIVGEIRSLNSQISGFNRGRDRTGAPGYLYDQLHAKQKLLADKKAVRDRELQKLGITLDEYSLKKGDFVNTFLQYAGMIAFKMLAQNEAKANVEYQHYENLNEVQKLKQTVTQLNQYYADSETLFMQGISWEATSGADINKYKTRWDYIADNYYCNTRDVCNDKTYERILKEAWTKNLKEKSATNPYYAKFYDKEAEAFSFLKEQTPAFPILGNPRFNVREEGKSYVSKSNDELREKVRTIIGTSKSDDGIIHNIANTREKIRGDVSLLWEMPPVIALSKMELGIIEGTVLDNIINDAYKAHQDKGFWTTVFKAALGIGLGLLALVSGPVGWAALGASIAYGAYDAYTTYQDIKWKTEASETAVEEEAMALMHDKPSMFWFVVSLVGVGFDAVQALKLVRAVKAGVDLSKDVKITLETEIALSRSELNGLKQGTKEFVDISRRVERLEKAVKEIDWVHYAEHSKILSVLKDNPFAIRFMANALADAATAKAFTKLAKLGLSEDLMKTIVGMYAGVGKKALSEFPEVMRLIESGKLATKPELVQMLLTDLKAQKALLDSGDPAMIAKLFAEWEAAAGKSLSFAEHLRKTGLNTVFHKGIVLTERYGKEFFEMSNLLKNKLILREIEPLLVNALNAKTLPPNVHRALELSLQRDVLGLTNDLGIAQERMATIIANLGSTVQFQTDYLKTAALLQNPGARRLFWEAAVQVPGRDEYLKVLEELAAANPKVKTIMDDLIKIGPLKDKATIERLIVEDAFRVSLANNPLAVMALKKCASPCFPPTATPDQIARLTNLLTGKSPDQISKVNELIYANRASEKSLEAAISKLEAATSIDDALKSVKVPETILPAAVKNVESIKAMAETAVSLGMPSSQLNNIIKTVAGTAGAATTSRVEGILGDLIMVLQMEKNVPMKNFGMLLNGLESADTGVFKTAEFLLDEVARFINPTQIEKGIFRYPGLQKADKILDSFSLGDLKSIIQKNKLQNGFINTLYSLTQKVKGNKAQLLELAVKAGEGGQSDLEKVLRIVGSSPGQLTYMEALDAIAKSKSFARDVAAAMTDTEHGFEKMAKLVWGEDAVATKDTISVAEKFRTGADAGSQAIAMVLKEEGKKLALANMVSSGGKVNYDKWKVLKSVVENSNISRSIKNNIIGELWTVVHIRALEQDGWRVLKEVKLSDGATVAKADAVAMKGNQMIVLEYKSLEGALSAGQEIIYPMLQDARIKTLKFIENTEADAFFAINRDKVKYQLLEESVLVPPT